MAGEETIKRLRFKDLVSLALGIRVCGLNKYDRQDDMMQEIIPKNSVYPCENIMIKYTAEANQTEFDIDII